MEAPGTEHVCGCGADRMGDCQAGSPTPVMEPTLCTCTSLLPLPASRCLSGLLKEINTNR